MFFTQRSFLKKNMAIINLINLLDEARDNARKLLCFALMVSLTIGTCCFIVAPFIPNLYNVDVPIKETIIALVRINYCNVFYPALFFKEKYGNYQFNYI